MVIGRMVTWNYISLAQRTSDFTRFWLDLFYLFFNFFLLNLILLIALSNVMEQFINDTLHFGFELMSIQLFNIRITTSPRFIFILPHKRLYSMECIAYCIRFLSYGKSIKHTTVLKKWGLRRILDTTGWNLCLQINTVYPYYPYWKTTRCIYCAFHLDCYWSLEPCLNWDYGKIYI
jgi:hypothetical protein